MPTPCEGWQRQPTPPAAADRSLPSIAALEGYDFRRPFRHRLFIVHEREGAEVAHLAGVGVSSDDKRRLEGVGSDQSSHRFLLGDPPGTLPGSAIRGMSVALPVAFLDLEF